jgi:hypothetical protein
MNLIRGDDDVVLLEVVVIVIVVVVVVVVVCGWVARKVGDESSEGVPPSPRAGWYCPIVARRREGLAGGWLVDLPG